MKNLTSLLKRGIAYAGLFSLPFSSNINAQNVQQYVPPDREWEQTYGANENEFMDAVALPDGNLIAVGHTNSTNGRGYDIYVEKKNTEGLTQPGFPKLFGDIKDEYSSAIILNKNNNLTIFGTTNSFSDNIQQIYLLEIDQNGNLLRQKNIEENFSIQIEDAIESSDGDYIITGHVGQSSTVLKIDNTSFSILKGTTLSGTGSLSLIETSNKDFLILGNTNAGYFDNDSRDIVLNRLNQQLDSIVGWPKIYNIANGDWGGKVIEDTDGTYLITGEAGNIFFGANIKNGFPFVMRLDNNGNKINSAILGSDWDGDYGKINTINKIGNNYIYSFPRVMVQGGSCFGNIDYDFNVRWRLTGNGSIYRNTIIDKNNKVHAFGRKDSLFYETKLTLEGPPIDPPPILPSVTPVPQKDYLVIATHGLNSSIDEWPSAMIDSIKSHLNPSIDPNKLEIFPYDWSDEAAFPDTNPKNVIAKAKARGISLGKNLSEHEYKYAHFIGHSAGSWLINRAATEIHGKHPSTEIFLTFLDPYIDNTNPAWELGKNSTMAENYFVFDLLTNLPTFIGLENAHNFNLFYADQPLSHSSPYKWYNNTISNSSTPASNFYGFIRSLEGGGNVQWDYTKTLPIGNSSLDFKKEIYDFKNPSENLISKSLDALISLIPNGLTFSRVQNNIKSNSESALWFHSNVPLPKGANYISFNYKFENTVPSFLDVYLNNNLVWRADQRVTGSELRNTEEIYIEKFLQSTNNFSFRLVPISQGNPEVFISNVETGKIEKIDHPNSSSGWNLYN